MQGQQTQQDGPLLQWLRQQIGELQAVREEQKKINQQNSQNYRQMTDWSARVDDITQAVITENEELKDKLYRMEEDLEYSRQTTLMIQQESKNYADTASQKALEVAQSAVATVATMAQTLEQAKPLFTAIRQHMEQGQRNGVQPSGQESMQLLQQCRQLYGDLRSSLDSLASLTSARGYTTMSTKILWKHAMMHWCRATDNWRVISTNT